MGCPATVGLPGNGPGSTALPWRAPPASPWRRLPQWAHGMAIHAQTVAAIAAGLTAVAAHGAATAWVNGELAAADEEARLTQEAIACKEAEVKALEEALAQGRAKKEAEERAHAEATAKAQEDAAKKEAIEAARRKVAGEKAKTEAELAAFGGAEGAAAAGPGSRGGSCSGGSRSTSCRSHPAPQWRRQRPNSATRLPREDREWRPFEGFSKGTPPPG